MKSTCKTVCKISRLVVGNLSRRLVNKLVISKNYHCGCNALNFGNDDTLVNIQNEKFYMKISREQAVDILKDKQNGTFIVRPSSSNNSNTMSIIQDGKVYHLKIGLRKTGRISLGEEKENEATFKNLNILINYYISNTLYLYSEERRTIETLLIPFH